MVHMCACVFACVLFRQVCAVKPADLRAIACSRYSVMAACDTCMRLGTWWLLTALE